MLAPCSGCRLAGCEYVICELDQLSGRYLIYNILRALAAGSRLADTWFISLLAKKILVDDLPLPYLWPVKPSSEK